jgi:hypothetical protein
MATFARRRHNQVSVGIYVNKIAIIRVLKLDKIVINILIIIFNE